MDSKGKMVKNTGVISSAKGQGVKMARSRRKKTQRTLDAFQNALTRMGVGMPNALEATEYPLTRLTRNWQLINSLYRSHWVVRRICDVIPEDMCKNGYKILSQISPDAMDKLTRVMRTTSTDRKVLKGLKWGRLYGGAGALIMLDGQEDMLSEPLDYESVMPGTYKGLMVMDRWSGISPSAELVDDIGSPEFGLPKYYTIFSEQIEKGTKVHHSRILRFTGADLPYLEELAEEHWGASVIEHTFDELRKRDNVSWNVAMLTFMANLRVMKIEGLEQIFATGSQRVQTDLYNTVQAMNTLMNNNSIQVIGANDDYITHQYTFGGIGETYDRFMMDVSGASEIPVTKLFGRSPAGMNATGESDLTNYYDTIEEKQEAYLRPIYDKLFPIILMSTFGAIPNDFDFAFNPVRKPNNDEMADLASKNTDSITKAFQAGLISQQTALKEMRSQSELTGMWQSITDEDIENADDTINNPDEGMMGMPMGGEMNDSAMETESTDRGELSQEPTDNSEMDHQAMPEDN
jgi:phage-related protein (TIGR01555 family)